MVWSWMVWPCPVVAFRLLCFNRLHPIPAALKRIRWQRYFAATVATIKSLPIDFRAVDI